MGVVETDQTFTKWEWGSKTRRFFLGSNDKPSIIKQFEHMSTYISETFKNVSIGQRLVLLSLVRKVRHVGLENLLAWSGQV